MAIDQALFEAVQQGAPPAIRFYRWNPACLSLGRNQVAVGFYDLEAAARRGIDIVRRPTGGRAVLHDRELTYAVAVPVGVLGSPRETYVAVNRALVAGLSRLGLPAAVAGETARPAPAAGAGAQDGVLAFPAPGSAAALEWMAPCFQEAAPGEVTVGGRKVVGSAQRREGPALLQHGSILLEGEQAVLLELVRGGPPPPPPHGTIGALLGRVPEWAELLSALVAGFESALGITFTPVTLSAAERDRAEELEAHFRSAAWTWRR